MSADELPWYHTAHDRIEKHNKDMVLERMDQISPLLPSSLEPWRYTIDQLENAIRQKLARRLEKGGYRQAYGMFTRGDGDLAHGITPERCDDSFCFILIDKYAFSD